MRFLMKITMDQPPPFERYQSPRISKLEVHRNEIAELLRLDWPLRKVASHLLEKHQLEVSCNRLWTFCKSRNIVKGRGEVPVQAEGELTGIHPPERPGPPPLPPVDDSSGGGDEDIGGLLEPKEAKSPFTKFKPQQKP